MGRQREFDVDQALCMALKVFWQKGFEGTSLTDLTQAMGITRPSLYAAFGNKEELFRKALDRYQASYMGFVVEALQAPTVREVVERLLFGYADVLTDGSHPPGCFGTNGALACSADAEPIRQELVARRAAQLEALRRRFDAARAAGDLPEDADPCDLAQYLFTVALGMAVQATSGADRATLHRVVATALCAFPGTGVAGSESAMAPAGTLRRSA
jgi:AcrR family transcriptional regulator